MHANFSPDGRFIAYTSNESGRYEVHAQTLPQSDRKWTISTNGGYEPRWRADSREIYYLSEDRQLMAVPVSTGAAPFGVPRTLFQTEVYAGVTSFRTHYVSNRDGTRFVVHTRSGDLVPVHHGGVELDRRVEEMSSLSSHALFYRSGQVRNPENHLRDSCHCCDVARVDLVPSRRERCPRP